MDPLTLGLIIAAPKIFNAIKGRSSSTPPSCRWCGDPISGSANTTACCHNTLCQSCTPQWKQAGGKNCVICGKTHA